MKIAVAYQDGEIYEHFGHCPLFAVYEYGEYVRRYGPNERTDI